jgi:hypothetical protein
MRIEVTAEDIRAGQRHDGCRCPIARALQRQVDTDVTVGASLAFWATGAPYQAVSALPPEARQFIYEFDSGRTVYPFTFNLEPAF